MFRIASYQSVASTNDLVKRAIEAGEPEGLVVCADRQTAGYGRQGRTWVSPAGGLYMSLLLRPQVEPAQLPTLSLVTGIALRRALAPYVPDAQVKWPNDVVCEQGKLAGISLEKHEDAVCVGIGVNVFPPAEALDVPGKNTPVYVADRAPAFQNSDCANDAARAAALPEIRNAALAEFSAAYAEWLVAGFAAFAHEFNTYSFLANRTVSIADNRGTVVCRGTVEAIGEDGCLLVCDNESTLRTIASGEAHLL